MMIIMPMLMVWWLSLRSKRVLQARKNRVYRDIEVDDSLSWSRAARLMIALMMMMMIMPITMNESIFTAFLVSSLTLVILLHIHTFHSLTPSIHSFIDSLIPKSPSLMCFTVAQGALSSLSSWSSLSSSRSPFVIVAVITMTLNAAGGRSSSSRSDGDRGQASGSVMMTTGYEDYWYIILSLFLSLSHTTSLTNEGGKERKRDRSI